MRRTNVEFIQRFHSRTVRSLLSLVRNSAPKAAAEPLLPLGIELFESNPAVIENAADQRMAHLRHYQAGPNSRRSQELLNEVASAKVCLLRPEKRTSYDATLRQHLQTVECATEQNHSPPFDAVIDATDGYSVVWKRLRLAQRRRRLRQTILLNLFGLGAVSLAGLLFWQGGLRWENLNTALLTQAGAISKENGVSSPKPPSAPLAHTRPAAKQPTRKIAPMPHPAGPRVVPLAVEPDATIPSEKVSLDLQVSHLSGASLFDRLLKPSPPTTPPVRSPVPTAPKRASRLPVPSRDSQQKVFEELEETYGAASSATPAEKLCLAQEFLELSKKVLKKPVERFVLLRRAAELAGEAGDVSPDVGSC